MTKEKHVLNIVGREGSGKGAARRLRRAGKIPAIVYGKGKPGRKIELKLSDWRSLMKEEINLVHLVENGKEAHLAVIQDVQEDFLRGCITHIDFHEVGVNELVTAMVPVHPHGTPAGVVRGGMLEQIMHEIQVEAKPEDLPESIIVEVDKLDFHAPICIKDIEIGGGAKIVHDPEMIVFNLTRVAAESTPAAEAGGAGEEKK